MGHKGKSIKKEGLFRIISGDNDLKDYYYGLPKHFREEIEKKEKLINSSEDLYQMIDYLIQDSIDNGNI